MIFLGGHLLGDNDGSSKDLFDGQGLLGDRLRRLYDLLNRKFIL
jgi:hypothetical protein